MVKYDFLCYNYIDMIVVKIRLKGQEKYKANRAIDNIVAAIKRITNMPVDVRISTSPNIKAITSSVMKEINEITESR